MKEKILKWLNEAQYDELIKGINNSPGKLLGAHKISRGFMITAYRPCAEKIWVVYNKEEFEMLQIDQNGFFAVAIPVKKLEQYQLKIQYSQNDIITIYDPYHFQVNITDMDCYLFGEGNHYEIYKKLGAHLTVMDGVKGTMFGVWAPNARSVSVVGDFNMWDGRLHPMNIIGVAGIYQLFIPGVEEGAIYKFQITTRDENVLLKCDPYANYAEVRPDNASKVADINHFKWTDAKYIKKNSGKDRIQMKQMPMSIYEVHLGSWKKHNDGTEDSFYNYRELADELSDYVKEMGYTHVELMGIAEHPFDGSWGYQVTGYFAPTSRYGTPEDFMYFINLMHSKGIQVILDWVPAHFPRDAHGLARFDGTPLYEHPDPRRGEHPHWGTYIFNYGKKEVENFLISNALFWLDQYHLDGLRVDAVASMLYLDYGKQSGEWLPNEDGGNENKEAISFFKHLNESVEERLPGKYIIAEESTAWPKVTAPVKEGGLGFLFKWNMGWMNDFLEYMRLDPYFKQFNHGKLCFSIMYAYSENFIQVLSHDEVVHGKGSMINKMPTEGNDKFSNLRTAYGFMYSHPGKKLLFMGQEFAQLREWSEARSLDWDLLDTAEHKNMQNYIKELNQMYLKYGALYENDYDCIGFEWMDCESADTSTVAFVRRGKTKSRQLLFVCNFTSIIHKNYRVGVPCKGKYKVILNSDDRKFGGNGYFTDNEVIAERLEANKRKNSIEFCLPPFSIIGFEYNYLEDKKNIMK